MKTFESRIEVFLEQTILAVLSLKVLVKRTLSDIEKKAYKWGNTGEKYWRQIRLSNGQVGLEKKGLFGSCVSGEECELIGISKRTELKGRL